jgi:hypothetical protein
MCAWTGALLSLKRAVFGVDFSLDSIACKDSQKIATKRKAQQKNQCFADFPSAFFRHKATKIVNALKGLRCPMRCWDSQTTKKEPKLL